MSNILYFFAGIYQALKNKKPNGTPYFNLRLGIFTNIVVHYLEIAVELKKHYGKDLILTSKILSVALLLSIGAFMFYLMGVIIPLDTLRDIEVDKKDIKLFYLLFCIYLFANIGLMFYVILSNTKFPPAG